MVYHTLQLAYLQDVGRQSGRATSSETDEPVKPIVMFDSPSLHGMMKSGLQLSSTLCKHIPLLPGKPL